MSYKFNPFTGTFDDVGSDNYAIINPVISNLTIKSPLILLEHNMILTGTLTLLGFAELLVI